MATLFVRATVADYAAFRAVYDERDAWRRSMGATSDGVYQLDGNPNDVTVYVEFASMDQAKAAAGSAEMREAMQRAGVQGQPDIWFAQRA